MAIFFNTKQATPTRRKGKVFVAESSVTVDDIYSNYVIESLNVMNALIVADSAMDHLIVDKKLTKEAATELAKEAIGDGVKGILNAIRSFFAMLISKLASFKRNAQEFFNVPVRFVAKYGSKLKGIREGTFKSMLKYDKDFVTIVKDAVSVQRKEPEEIMLTVTGQVTGMISGKITDETIGKLTNYVDSVDIEVQELFAKKDELIKNASEKEYQLGNKIASFVGFIESYKVRLMAYDKSIKAMKDLEKNLVQLVNSKAKSNDGSDIKSIHSVVKVVNKASTLSIKLISLRENLYNAYFRDIYRILKSAASSNKITTSKESVTIVNKNNTFLNQIKESMISH